MYFRPNLILQKIVYTVGFAAHLNLNLNFASAFKEYLGKGVKIIPDMVWVEYF